MKKNKKNSLVWRRLDNSAKIFPLSTGKRYSTVFRVSVLLNQDNKQDILKEAVIKTLEKYPSFKVKMKKGFFWHYLESNTKTPIIEEEKDYPCRYIDPRLNNGYLFKVTYFKNKINIDIFHALTDGDSGTVFFREIVYTYLEMCYPNELRKEDRTIRKIEYTTEDSYLKNYDKKSKSSVKDKRAYKLKGKKIKLGAVSVIHQIINLEQLKLETKKYNSALLAMISRVEVSEIEVIFERVKAKAVAHQWPAISLLQLLHIPVAFPAFAENYVRFLEAMPPGKRDVSLVPLLANYQWADALLMSWENDPVTPKNTIRAIQALKKGGK